MLSGINLNLSRSCLEGVKLTNANLGVAYLGKSLEGLTSGIPASRNKV
jgi:hypothetical protein